MDKASSNPTLDDRITDLLDIGQRLRRRAAEYVIGRALGRTVTRLFSPRRERGEEFMTDKDSTWTDEQIKTILRAEFCAGQMDAKWLGRQPEDLSDKEELARQAASAGRRVWDKAKAAYFERRISRQELIDAAIETAEALKWQPDEER